MAEEFRKLPPDVITNLESAPWRFAYTMVGITPLAFPFEDLG